MIIYKFIITIINNIRDDDDARIFLITFNYSIRNSMNR